MLFIKDKIVRTFVNVTMYLQHNNNNNNNNKKNQSRTEAHLQCGVTEHICPQIRSTDAEQLLIVHIRKKGLSLKLFITCSMIRAIFL
jgi:hypothetical protein